MSLTIHGCKTKKNISLLSTVIHWIDEEWRKCEKKIALEKVEREHSRGHFVKVLQTLLKNFSLEKKV